MMEGIGGDGFSKEVASLTNKPPDCLEINSDEVSLVQIEQEIRDKSEQLLRGPGLSANQLVPRVWVLASMPIYLCQKAASLARCW